jgi:hypothetical protein
MPQIVVAAAAFDVAPTDVHQDVARAGVAAAECVEGGGREQRVIAVHGVAPEERRRARAGAEERAARRDLRLGAIVHEHEFGVHARLVAEVVVREQAGRLALVIALIEVRRREVVQVGCREIPHHAVLADGEIADGVGVVQVGLVVGQEPPARSVAGTAAGERVGSRIAGVG